MSGSKATTNLILGYLLGKDKPKKAPLNSNYKKANSTNREGKAIEPPTPKSWTYYDKDNAKSHDEVNNKAIKKRFK